MNLFSESTQTNSRGRRTGFVMILACLAAFLTVFPVLAEEAPKAQQITITVLDRMDRPVEGAVVSAQARAGNPEAKGPWQTDASGRVIITWLPKRTDLAKGTRSEDRIYELKSDLLLTVSASGFSTNTLALSAQAKGQVMANPSLASLTRKAELRPLKEVVVLAKTTELLAGRLTQKGYAPKAGEKCLAFISRNREALKNMGISFASPAFELKGDLLRLRVKWNGPAWGGLGRMPFKTRVILNAGLPLALALGKEVLPLPGVNRADIWVESEERPGGDELAAARGISVIFGASAKAFASLGNGRVSPRRFVRDNPAVTRRTGG